MGAMTIRGDEQVYFLELELRDASSSNWPISPAMCARANLPTRYHPSRLRP